MTGQTFRARAVLFDLDGTIADTLADIHAALNAARAACALPPVDDPRLVRSWIGHGARALIARSLGDVPRDAPEVDRLLTTFRTLYPAMSGRHARLADGFAAWAQELQAAGKLIGLTTNKPRAATLTFLAALGIDRLFDVVLTPDDVDERVKPDPAMLIAAAEALAVPVDACVLIGDGDADIGAARAAGMRVIAVLDGFGDPDALVALGPDACVDHTLDARALII